MKLGLMTAAFPGQSLEQVDSWVWGNGFEILEIACYPVGKADRRYAGVTTIDVTAMIAAKAGDIRGTMQKHGLEISHWGVLSQPTAPRTGPSRAGDRAPEESDPDR